MRGLTPIAGMVGREGFEPSTNGLRVRKTHNSSVLISIPKSLKCQ